MNVKELVFVLIAVETETEFHEVLGELQEVIGVDNHESFGEFFHESFGEFFDVSQFMDSTSRSRRQMILSYISNEINYLTK
jgi:hypothetical protein